MCDKKTVLSILTTVCIILLVPISLFAASKHLTIIHFNDLHGYLQANCSRKECIGGASRIATLVKKIEKENANLKYDTIILFGGDAFSGTPISEIFEGDAEFSFFNALGIDAMVLGNHEFDYSLSTLEKRMNSANFPVIAANIRFKKTKKLLTKPTAIIEKPDGLRVGIVGVVSERTPLLTRRQNVIGLEFENPIVASRKYLKNLKNTALKIALTHMAINSDKKLAKKVRGFDVIIGGHDDAPQKKYCTLIYNVPICKTPPNGHYVGKVDFEILNDHVAFIQSELIPINEMVPEDQKISALMRKYTQQIDSKYNQVIGKALSHLPKASNKESPLGDLITDAMRETTNSDIAFINSGGIRAPINEGPITFKDVAQTLPFNNQLIMLTLSGKKLLEVIDFMAKHRQGSFLQVSGISFRIGDRKAVNVKINGEKLNPKKTYKATTVDFLTEGGDGYKMLKSIPSKNIKYLLRDAVCDYIRQKKIIIAPELNRILP